MPHRFAIVSTFVGILGAAAPLTAAETPTQSASKIQFNRDIRPILSDKCFACHGLDAKKREAELRLDTLEGAVAQHKKGAAVVPGDLGKSQLWTRIKIGRAHV